MIFKILISSSLIFLASCSSAPSKNKVVTKKIQKSQSQSAKRSLANQKRQVQKSQTANPYYKMTAKNFNQDMVQKSDGVLLTEAISQSNSKQYGLALLTIDRIQTQYPKSSKLSKVLFLKLKIYKQMNLDRQALTVYSQLKKQFPGAMEAHLAEGLIRR